MDSRLSSPPLPLPVSARDSAPREAGLTQEGRGGGFCSGDRTPAPGTVRTDSLEEVRCSELESSSSPALWGGY